MRSTVRNSRKSQRDVDASKVSVPTRVRLRDLGLPALLPAWVAVGYVMYFVVAFYVRHDAFGGDAHAYWLTAHRSALYIAGPTERDAYLYSPAFATAIWPIAILPWPIFFGIWMLAETVVLAWLVAPLGWALAVPAFMLCSAEIVLGDINAFLALVAVVGMSRAGAWAVPLLTKIAPGLGPLWFAVRREWRNVAISLGVTALIAALSFAITPGYWADWVHFLLHHRGRGSLFFPARLLVAVLLTIFAARRNRPTLLAWAMLLAAPVVHNAAVPTVLAALPRLRRANSSTGSAQRRPAPSGPHAGDGPR